MPDQTNPEHYEWKKGGQTIIGALLCYPPALDLTSLVSEVLFKDLSALETTYSDSSFAQEVESLSQDSLST